MFKFSSGSWRYLAGLYSKLMPEPLNKDVYPQYPFKLLIPHLANQISSSLCTLQPAATW